MSSSGPILFFADLFQPVDNFAVALFLNSDMRHSGGRRSPMPVLLAGREPDHITGTDLLDRTSPTLCQAATGRDDERLTERMRVPCGTCARFEGNAGALNKGRIGRLKERIDPHGTSEPVRRSLGRRLRANSFDVHVASILQRCTKDDPIETIGYLLTTRETLPTRPYQLLQTAGLAAQVSQPTPGFRCIKRRRCGFRGLRPCDPSHCMTGPILGKQFHNMCKGASIRKMVLQCKPLLSGGYAGG